jgi:hypothetical protein
MKGTELLISSRPYSGELPAKITQALTLLGCFRNVPVSNVGWHTHDLGSLCAFPQSSEARTGIANLIYIRKRAFTYKFLPI